MIYILKVYISYLVSVIHGERWAIDLCCLLYVMTFATFPIFYLYCLPQFPISLSPFSYLTLFFPRVIRYYQFYALSFVCHDYAAMQPSTWCLIILPPLSQHAKQYLFSFHYRNYACVERWNEKGLLLHLFSLPQSSRFVF